MAKRIYLLLGSAFILLLIVIYLYHRSFVSLNQYMDAISHTHEVITAFTELANDFKTAEMIASDIGQAHSDALSELYTNTYGSIRTDIIHLKKLVTDNVHQQVRLDSLAALFDRNIEEMNRSTSVEGEPPSNRNFFVTVLKVQRLIDEGITIERELLSRRRISLEKTDTLNTVLGVVLVSTALGLIVVISISNVKQVIKRRNLESFLESVLNTSQNPIITFDAVRDGSRITDFRIIFSNDIAQQKIPMAAAENSGKSLFELSCPTIDTKTFFSFVRVTETGNKADVQLSFPYESSERWYNVLLSKLNHGLTATFHDITEIKNYQQELQRKVELLEHKNNELEQFAFVASHDLQEPLRKIKTFSSLINERFNEPSAAFAKVYLHKVIRAADRMSSLISDLLHLSDLNRQRESFKPTDLDWVLDNVLTDLELIIEEKSAVVSREPLQVIDAIPMQMNQLFFNLINNALKFARKDVAPKISVSCSKVTKEAAKSMNLNPAVSYLEIIFKDNGIGFKPEYTQKIFVIFQRLNSPQSYSGSGIGLALCKKIVLNHRGEIYAEGVENEGACFHVILPEIQLTQTPEV